MKLEIGDIMISDYTKLTLLDFPEKISAIAFSSGCNFRCPFCHNSPLVRGQILGDKDREFIDYLKKRKGVIEGVVISGGEPLLHGDIIDFIKGIKDMGFAVKLDTNGYECDKLKTVLKTGLVDYVAMDIKSSPENYAMVAGIKNLDIDRIRESISAIKELAPDYEFRTTFVKGLHTFDDADGISSLIKKCKKYFLQNFVDSGNILCTGNQPFTPQEMATFEQLLAGSADFCAVR